MAKFTKSKSRRVPSRTVMLITAMPAELDDIGHAMDHGRGRRSEGRSSASEALAQLRGLYEALAREHSVAAVRS
jgi:hypothetical protein